MTDFSENVNSGCFCNTFRRIACFRSPPTHPADHILESKMIKSEDYLREVPKAEAKTQASANPGIVARLMGLDSLPENNWVSRKRIPDSVVRSRSVNFADYMLEFDLTQTQHRRVRTSVSFREVPTLSHQQNGDFVVVYLNDVGESKGMSSKVRKSEMGVGELKQRKEQRSKNKESMREKEIVKKKKNQRNNKIAKFRDEPRRVSGNLSSKVGNGKRLGHVPTRKKNVCRNEIAGSKTKSPLKPMNQKELFVEPQFKSKRKTRHLAVKVVPECDTNNSSPLSVLEVNDCSIQQERNISESSRRVSYSDDVRIGVIKNKDCVSVDNSETRYYKELIGNLYRLTENDIKESNWTAKNFIGFEVFEEVCMEFEQHVLDLLLNQVVDEFVEIPEKSQ